MKRLIISSIAGIALMTGCATNDHSYQKAANTSTSSTVAAGESSSGSLFSNIPQQVKDTLKKEAPDGEVVAIIKQTRNGTTIYEVAFTHPDRYPKIRIAADGTVVTEKDKG